MLLDLRKLLQHTAFTLSCRIAVNLGAEHTAGKEDQEELRGAMQKLCIGIYEAIRNRKPAAFPSSKLLDPLVVGRSIFLAWSFNRMIIFNVVIRSKENFST
eukprot:g64.t1